MNLLIYINFIEIEKYFNLFGKSKENDRIFRNNTIFKNFKIDSYNIYNK